MNNVEFQGLGWQLKVQSKRNNYLMTLVKEVVLGNGLRKGSELYCYLTKFKGRNALLMFLDEKGINDYEVVLIRRGKILVKT